MRTDSREWTIRKFRLLAMAAAIGLIGLIGQSGGSSGADAPPREDASRPQTAAGWAVKGWNLVRAADYRAAAEAFAAANRLDGTEPSFLVGLGLSRHRLRQDDAAAAALEHALRLDANAGQAHALLGDIYERRGDAAAARRHYEAAFRQDPNDVLVQERLAEITREAGFGAPDRLFSAHFLVKYRGSENRPLAHQVADRLEQAYRRIGRLLSYEPAEPFTAILYSDRQFQAATLSPAWSHGYFDGRIHLPREAVQQSPQAVQRILDHEYVHAAVYRLSGGHAPTWLDEGLARYCEDRIPQEDRAGEPSIRDRDSLYSLHGDFMSLPRHTASAAYAQSLGATTALIQRHGLTEVRRLLDTLLVVPDFPQAFEAVLHERYSDFNRVWILSEEKRKG